LISKNNVAAVDEMINSQPSPNQEITTNYTPNEKLAKQTVSQDLRDHSSGETLKFIAITNLTRPFPLGDFEEQLREYGPINQFWIDKFRSHCYVQYETGDGASLCKNMLSGVQFPPDTGKKLGVALLGDSEGLDLLQKERLSTQRFILTLEGDKPELQEYQDAKRTLAKRLPSLRRSSQDVVRDDDRKRQRTSLPPQLPLDTLFLKTVAKPCLYYKPNKSFNPIGKTVGENSKEFCATATPAGPEHSVSIEN